MRMAGARIPRCRNRSRSHHPMRIRGSALRSVVGHERVGAAVAIEVAEVHVERGEARRVAGGSPPRRAKASGSLRSSAWRGGMRASPCAESTSRACRLKVTPTGGVGAFNEGAVRAGKAAGRHLRAREREERQAGSELEHPGLGRAQAARPARRGACAPRNVVVPPACVANRQRTTLEENSSLSAASGVENDARAGAEGQERGEARVRS